MKEIQIIIIFIIELFLPFQVHFWRAARNDDTNRKQLIIKSNCVCYDILYLIHVAYADRLLIWHMKHFKQKSDLNMKTWRNKIIFMFIPFVKVSTACLQTAKMATMTNKVWNSIFIAVSASNWTGNENYSNQKWACSIHYHFRWKFGRLACLNPFPSPTVNKYYKFIRIAVASFSVLCFAFQVVDFHQTPALWHCFVGYIAVGLYHSAFNIFIIESFVTESKSNCCRFSIQSIRLSSMALAFKSTTRSKNKCTKVCWLLIWNTKHFYQKSDLNMKILFYPLGLTL